MMKLEKLRLTNFAQFEDFELVFNDGITNLVGMNGDGKTTVGLTSLWAGFRGIAEKSTTGALPGQRFRFITNGKKSLDIEITLRDELENRTILLKRHITKATNTIKITSSDGAGLDRQYIENLFNVSFLSATHFSALTGKEQAAAMGIDTFAFDADLKEKKEDAQGYRRDIKKIGDLTPVTKVEKKDIDVLYRKQKTAMEYNEAISVSTATLSTWKDRIEEVDKDIDEEIAVFEAYKKKHDAKVEALNESRIEASTTVKEFPVIGEPMDLKPIEMDIKTIVESNQEYYKYETYTTSLAELEEFQRDLDKNLKLQGDINTERSKYLQSKSFGIKGLQIDEDGNLTKDNKLIRAPYFSQGELEVLVARIGMNLNPELKVRFIDNFDLIDDDNQIKIVKHLTKKGFQIITATVGKKIMDNHSVLLRECKIVKGTVNEKKANLTPIDVDSLPVDNVVGSNEVNVDGDWDDLEGDKVRPEGYGNIDTMLKPPEPDALGTTNYDDDEF